MLYAVLSKMLSENPQDYAILAIGSDRATGDSVGPLVGQLVSGHVPTPVFGTLRSPVTALNLEHSYTCMKLRYPRGKVIAIDSCIGSKADIGAIKISESGLYPAAAMGKKMRKVGDISITAVVADKKEDLGTVRLGLVYEMASAIAAALREILAESRHRGIVI